MNHGYLAPGLVFNIGVLISFCVYILYSLRYHKELITGLYYLFTPLIMLNLFTLFIQGIGVNPNGHTEYLLGGRNHIVFTVIPFLLIVHLYSNINKKSTLHTYILYAVGMISLILTGSATGIVVMIVFSFYFFYPKFIRPSYFGYLTLYAFLFFSLVIYRLQERFFRDFIVDVLDRDLTLSGRTFVWDTVIYNLRENWLIGLGRGNTVVNDRFSNLQEAHNGLLEIIIDSGFVGLSLFTMILLLIGKSMKKYKSYSVYGMVTISIFLFLIVGLTESIFLKQEFWLILVIAYCMPNIVQQHNKSGIMLN